jgi:hypothetical protein
MENARIGFLRDKNPIRERCGLVANVEHVALATPAAQAQQNAHGVGQLAIAADDAAKLAFANREMEIGGVAFPIFVNLNQIGVVDKPASYVIDQIFH